MPLQLDNTTESSVITPVAQKNYRTIYDAGSGEIFWKSLVAGFGLGVGRSISSLIFYAVMFGIFITFISPMLSEIMAPINRLIPILEQSNTQQQNFQNQVKGVFSGFGAGTVEDSTTQTTY